MESSPGGNYVTLDSCGEGEGNRNLSLFRWCLATMLCLLLYVHAWSPSPQPIAASWLHMSWGGSANGSTWGSHRQEWANKIRGFSKRKAFSRVVLFHHGSLLPTADATSGDSSRLLSVEGLWKSGDFKAFMPRAPLWKGHGKGSAWLSMSGFARQSRVPESERAG